MHVCPQLAVERETAGSVCVFSALVSAIERSQAELMEVLELSRRAAEHQADVMIRQLELEVEELRSRESALAQLAQSDDQIHCVKVSENLMRFSLMMHGLRTFSHTANIVGYTGLFFQTFPIISSPPPAKDWSGVSVNSDLGTGTIYRSLAALVERFQEDLRSIAETGQHNAKHKHK